MAIEWIWIKKQKRIDDQKQLEQLLRERDERLKARANRK